MKSIFTKLVPDYIRSINPYEPGKPIEEVERELGISNSLKLASNENPLGPSPKAVRAMRDAVGRVNYYPEGGSPYLLTAVAKRLKVKESELVFGTGSNEVIELLMRCLLRKGDNIVTSRHAFLVYRLIAQGIGASVREAKAKDYGHDLDAMAKLINSKTRILFIANPNNPTGTYVTETELVKFLKKIPKVPVVMDEAYYEYVSAKDYPDTVKLRKKFPNLIVLRTFSKCFGLAGLRVGYGVGDKELVNYLNRLRQPFNVNSMAQVGALAALGDAEFLQKSIKTNSDGKRQLYKAFDKVGIEYLPTEANFICVNVGHGREVFEHLQKEGVIVRPMDVYGLPAFIRVTIGKKAQNVRFLNALKRVLAA